MTLFAIRHGESTANLQGIHAGWAQVPLSSKGFEQAGLAGHFLRKIKFDKVYASDLIRAKQTALTALQGCEIQESPLLREIDVGQLSGKSPEQCRKEYGEKYTKAHADFDFTPFGGENNQMHRQRAVKFLDMVAASGNECVAAFTHEGTIRLFAEHICGGNIPKSAFKISNCAVYGFEYENGVWRLSSVLPTEHVSLMKA